MRSFAACPFYAETLSLWKTRLKLCGTEKRCSFIYLFIYQQDKMMMTGINELSDTTSSLRSTADAFAKTSEHPVQACLR